MSSEMSTRPRGTYGAPRVHAELRLGREIVVGHTVIARLMRNAGPVGVPLTRRLRRTIDQAPSVDLVERDFARAEPDQLWVTDITEHAPARARSTAASSSTPSRDAWSAGVRLHTNRRCRDQRVGDRNREPSARQRGLVHADHGVQFTSWAFTHRLRTSGLLPSMGSVADCYDNALVEAFWGRMQTELLNRRRWNTRVELANAMFDHIEIFHNRQRRHSSIGMLTPIEYENRHTATA